MFDPFTSTFEDAAALSEGANSPTSPLSQWFAAQKINKLEHVDDLDGFAVLGAIRECITSGLVAPEWLAYAFNSRYNSVLSCRAKSWDDPKAFGLPYKKGTNIASLRKKRMLMFAVWNEIILIKKMNPDTPIDDGLFESVGKKFALGKTLCSEYYYSAKSYLY
jgi:hypothetical protein